MSNNYYIETIKQQLHAGGIMKVLSWGAQEFTKLDEFTLMFKVNALRLTGYFFIRYCRGSATYTIFFSEHQPKFTDVSKKHYSVVPHEEFNVLRDIYFDQMTDVIDRVIEWVPVYQV